MRSIKTALVVFVTLFGFEALAQVEQAKYILLIGSDGLGAYAFEKADRSSTSSIVVDFVASEKISQSASMSSG